MKKNLNSSVGAATRSGLYRRALGLVWTASPRLTILWAVILLVQGLLPAAAVYLAKLTVDGFVALQAGSGSFSQAALFLTLTGVCLLATEILQYLGDWVRTAKSEFVSDHLKDLIHEKSVSVDLEFYESPEFHDLMEQVRGEASSKPLALLESVGSIIQSAITMIAFVSIIVSYGWMIPLLLLAGTLPGLYVSLRHDRIYHRWWKERANDRRWLFYFDAMLTHGNAAAEVRLFDLGERFRSRYQNLRKVLRGERLERLRRQYFSKVLANSGAMATAAVAIGWLALRVHNSLATIGDLVVFYGVFSRGQILARSFFGGVGQMINNSLYLESLFTFLDLRPKIAADANPVPFPSTIEHGIHFRGITFCYPGESRAAIRDLELVIPAGTVAAIVGVNGAGKTTLVKLLCRFYDVQKGSIEIDGIDIRRFDVNDLRRNISVLFQYPMQFHETVENSIALSEPGESLDPERVETACRRAGAQSFIERFPDGYRTLLGKWFVNGCELSGGEWQRIALARAYYRRSKLLVLDEPTSFMDPWAESDWFNRFRELAIGRTGLIITHRFTIAMRADVIHVIDDGRLLESGTHCELIRKNGFYAGSWKAQQAAVEEQIDPVPSFQTNGRF